MNRQFYDDRWIYRNERGEHVRCFVLLPPGVAKLRKKKAGGFEEWGFDLRPGQMTEIQCSPHRLLEVYRFDPETGQPGELVARGSVGRLCVGAFEDVAEKIGADPAEFYARWKKIKKAKRKTRYPAGTEYPGTELDEEPNLEGLETLSATFEMNDKGGLHTRPAVLIYKALASPERSFDHVEARNEGNGRVARMRRGIKTSPAFWLLLLRLEARRGELVNFTVAADTEEEAASTLEAIAGVLGRPKPERHDYWRELGIAGWSEIYLEDFTAPETEGLAERFRIFGKARQDRGPEPDPGTPMAERVGA